MAEVSDWLTKVLDLMMEVSDWMADVPDWMTEISDWIFGGFRVGRHCTPSCFARMTSSLKSSESVGT